MRALVLLVVACGPKAPPPAAPASAPAPAQAAKEAPAPVSAPSTGWRHPLHADHPAVGHILDVATGDWIDRPAVEARAAAHPYVLLGEKHDNADHHQLQAELVAALAGPGVPVVFEMLDDGDSAALEGVTGAAGVAEATAWGQSGWPDYDLYEAVFASVYQADAQPVAGHPTRSVLKTAMMEGLGAVQPAALAGLPPAPSAAVEALHADDIRASHCGYATDAMMPPMVLGQVLKDQWMARALLREERGVLVAGGGHTRLDRGVPLHLDNAFVVLFAEVPRGGAPVDPTEYTGAADVVWFTPRVDDLDPCDVFLEQLKSLGPVEP